MSRKKIHLICSLDVEEEGLFRGTYRIKNPPVKNLGCLHKLDRLITLGIRPTLFCSYSVLSTDKAWQECEQLLRSGRIEIGCHLHHWNTPPLVMDADQTRSVPSCDVPADIFAGKLETLLEKARERLGYRPVSFRMGKWDLLQRHWPLLARAGIQADASVRPLHATNSHHSRPDHFHAPRSPYLIEAAGRVITELPLTVTPVSAVLPALAKSSFPGAQSVLLPKYEQWGALALLPVYHPLWAMKAVTKLFTARGGRVLSLTWHSSEMMPGGNPALPREQDTDNLLRKLEAYLLWLQSAFDVSCQTLGDYHRTARLQVVHCGPEEDWATAL